jgi:dTDP-4-dehydrorhamnose reductase
MWPQHVTTSTLHVLIPSQDFCAIAQHRLSSIALDLLASQTLTRASIRKLSVFSRTLFSLAEFVKHAIVREYPSGHVSSGCIFEGSRPDGSGFVESDIPSFCFRSNHCSFYSGTKALGEEVLADCSSCFIWRPRMPFNEIDSPRNYLSKLMTYERILNATNSLSHLDEFAKICLECWRRRCDYGIYNVVNTGSVTTKQIVSLLQKHVAIGKRFEYFESEKEFLRLAAIAPRSNCVLDNAKLRATGVPVRSIEDALLDAIQRWNRS